MKPAAKRLILCLLIAVFGGVLATSTPSYSLDLTPGIDAGTAWSFGNMESASGALASRGVQMLAFHAFPNLKFTQNLDGVPLRLLPGFMGEFRLLGQLTDPA